MASRRLSTYAGSDQAWTEATPDWSKATRRSYVRVIEADAVSSTVSPGDIILGGDRIPVVMRAKYAWRRRDRFLPSSRGALATKRSRIVRWNRLDASRSLSSGARSRDP